MSQSIGKEEADIGMPVLPDLPGAVCRSDRIFFILDIQDTGTDLAKRAPERIPGQRMTVRLFYIFVYLEDDLGRQVQ